MPSSGENEDSALDPHASVSRWRAGGAAGRQGLLVGRHSGVRFVAVMSKGRERAPFTALAVVMEVEEDWAAHTAVPCRRQSLPQAGCSIP